MQDEQGRRCRRWFGTAFVLADNQLQNKEYFIEQTERLENIVEDEASWFVGQYERGESGRAHLQFCIHFPEARTRRVVAGLECWPQKPHLEPARGTVEHCVAYCSKEAGRICPGVELGVRPAQGTRNDLVAIYWRLRRDGHRLRDVADDYVGQYMRVGASFHRAQNLYKPLVQERAGIVIWGPTGTGKSRNSLRAIRQIDYYDKANSQWWCGYDNEAVVLWDDFAWRKQDFESIFTLMDWRPTRVQTKFGSRSINAKWFIFTANDDPEG